MFGKKKGELSTIYVKTLNLLEQTMTERRQQERQIKQDYICGG